MPEEDNRKMNLMKIHIFALVSLVLSIVVTLYTDQPLVMLWTLASIALGNIAGEMEEDYVWNDGICREYGEPWEFVENEMHTETTTNHYRCRDKWLSASPRDHFYKTYKGDKNKIEL